MEFAVRHGSQEEFEGLRQDIIDIIWSAIDFVNETASDGNIIRKEFDTPLLGADDGVDSLGFINLVVALEDEIRRQKKMTVVLVSEEALTSEEHPFRSVRSLMEYVDNLVEA